MSEGVIALDATGKITLINPVCCEMLNLPGYEDVRDHPIEQWITDANLLDSVQLLLHGEHSFLQVEITLDDAPVRVLSTSITPKQDGGCILVLTGVQMSVVLSGFVVILWPTCLTNFERQ